MSKSKHPSTRAEVKKPSKLYPIAHAIATAAIKVSKNKTAIASIAFIALITCLACLTSVGAYSTAMLYLIANNGKLSGRSDGNVYMRNGRVRGFKVPALVQNAYTQTQRVQLGLLSAQWRSLTNAQQLSWNNLSGLFRSNRFGVPVEVKGKGAFVLLNMNLFNIGLAAITTAPTFVDVPCITSATVTATSGANTVSIAFAPTPTSADIDTLVFATANKGAGIFKPGKSQYRLIDVIPNTTATPYAAGTAYVAKFGNLVSGQKMFIKLVGINNTTGQASPALEVSTTIV